MLLDWRFSEIPKPYSMFHLMWFGVLFILLIISFLIAKNKNDTRDSYVVFFVCLFLLATEVFKQFYKYYEFGGKYQWGAFPFQLCSIPMYLGTIVFFIPNKKVKEAIYQYIAFTGVIGGTAILLFPTVTATYSIIMASHSMLWHVMLVCLGIYLIKSREYGKHILKETFAPTIILTIVVIIAIILNFTLYPYAQQVGAGFNMISLSYFQRNDPAILDMIFKLVPYPVYVLIVYLLLYLSMPFVTSITYLIRLLHSKIINEKTAH